jgi:hypothetical protein
MKPWLNARKTKTQWLWGNWEGLSGPQLKQKLLEKMAASEVAQEKFWGGAKIEGTEDCWEWQRALDSYGYGTFSFQYESRQRTFIFAHRIAYFLTHGELPDKLVCHHCDNTKCVNPDHLFLGNNNDNRQDSVQKGRHTRGEGQHLHKLTDNKVKRIRLLYFCGGMNGTEISRKFEVSKQCIFHVVYGRTWKHVPFPKGFEPYE